MNRSEGELRKKKRKIELVTNGSLKALARGGINTFREEACASACSADVFEVLVGHQGVRRRRQVSQDLRFYTWLGTGTCARWPGGEPPAVYPSLWSPEAGVGAKHKPGVERKTQGRTDEQTN